MGISRGLGGEASCRGDYGHRVSSLALVAAVLPARFSSRREEKEGARQGCACLLLPPLPSAGPFPSRQETSSESQPAAVWPPPPPQAHGVTLCRVAAGRALRLRPGSWLRKTWQIPRGAGSQARPPVPGPRPSLPHACPTRGFQAELLGVGRQKSLSPSPLTSDSDKAWDTGVKRPLFWGAWRERAEARPGIPAGRVRGWRKAHLT